ncbi:hypothetical protein BK816_05285 [Boudabousia tangfeifanii]|uniref:AI-2E family transporter n=1 Tax=Boudabousia tangfeifanii TaxID=1912795 RepID=A0A1D9MKE0_9ACTO|nr:AI-2E family transporter [Boudabousia tangfeifanii]AOZ72777.1 hypothetical protein BK816_05285 [Boudabousia tangfeifanii]
MSKPRGKALRQAAAKQRRKTRPLVSLGNYAPHWLARAGIDAWLLIGITIVLWGALMFLVKIQEVFFAVFLGLIITAILNPIVTFLSRFLPRLLATFITLIGALALVVGMFTYVISSVAGTWPVLVAQFGHGINQIVVWADRPSVNRFIKIDDVEKWLATKQSEVLHYLSENTGSIANQIMTNAANVTIIMTVLVLAIFVSIFTLYSGQKMWEWCLNQLPREHRFKTHLAASVGWNTFSGYARGTMIIASTDAFMVFIFLSILGVPLAAPSSVLVLIGAFIPLIGAPIAMFVAMIVALATKGWITALIVGIGIFAIGQLEGHVLQPLIMAHQVSLHPMVVGIAVAAGTFLGGLLGAVIAVPVIAVIWAVYAQLHEMDPPMINALPTVKEMLNRTGWHKGEEAPKEL